MNREVGLDSHSILSQSLISHTVSKAVKHHELEAEPTDREAEPTDRVQELYEQGDGMGLGSHSLSHSLPVPNKHDGFCGRKAP